MRGAWTTRLSATLAASGLFDRDELVGITRRVQYALLRIIAEEERNETIDQRTLRTRAAREEQIEQALALIKNTDDEATK